MFSLARSNSGRELYLFEEFDERGRRINCAVVLRFATEASPLPSFLLENLAPAYLKYSAIPFEI